jgi:hypothetical protein
MLLILTKYIDRGVLEQQRILRILECIAKNVHEDIATNLACELHSRLKSFNSSPLLIQAMVRTLVQVLHFVHGLLISKLCKMRNDSSVDHIAQEILSICDNVLSAYVLPRSSMLELSQTMSDIQIVNLDADQLMRYLFTMGELAQVSICCVSITNDLVALPWSCF